MAVYIRNIIYLFLIFQILTAILSPKFPEPEKQRRKETSLTAFENQVKYFGLVEKKYIEAFFAKPRSK